MADCDHCGTDSLLNTCNYCQGKFCKDHVLPENHDCIGLQVADTPGLDFRDVQHDDQQNDSSDDFVSRENLPWTSGGETTKRDDAGETPENRTSTSNGPERTDLGAELPGAAKDNVGSSSPDVNPDGSLAQTSDGDDESDGQVSLSTRARRSGVTISGLVLMAVLAPFRAVKRLPAYLRRFNRWLEQLLGSLFGLIKTATPIIAIALGALFLAGLAGTGVPVIDENAEAGADAVAGVFDDDNAEEVRLMEQAVHSEVNRVRESRDLNTVSYNHEVAGVARNHSQDMAERGYFDHVGPNGTTLSDRLATGGVSCTAYGENLANLEGFGTDPDAVATRVVEMWLNSPGHRENLLRSGWAAEGIGVEIRGDEIWVTQVFCS